MEEIANEEIASNGGSHTDPYWGEWEDVTGCVSGCLNMSTGAIKRSRECIIPKPVTTAETCQVKATGVRHLFKVAWVLKKHRTKAQSINTVA